MSRINENKLKMKDIATIGIFSALLFVVTMVAGALMGISMVLNMYSVAVVAVLSAPLYMQWIPMSLFWTNRRQTLMEKQYKISVSFYLH